MSTWERDTGGLPPAPPGKIWQRFMGGPLDGWRMLVDEGLPDTLLHTQPPDRTWTRYVRQRSVEQLDIEAIYYPDPDPGGEE